MRGGKFLTLTLQVFELVTLEHLFRYQRNRNFDLDEVENMLYQMMQYTEEYFRAAQLQVSPRAPEYFDANCKHPSLRGILVDDHLSTSSGQLKKNPTIFNWPIEARLDELSGEEVTTTASLIRRCLHLDPAHRSTVAELLGDHWFNGVE